MTRKKERSMFRPRIFWGLGLAVALALTFGARSASADVFDLNNTHQSGSGQPISPPYGTVTLTGGGTEVFIVYQANTTDYPNLLGFHEVGFNYAASGGSSISTITVTSNSVSNTFPSEGATGMDGYGAFTNVFGQPGGGATNQATTVTVDIVGSNLSLANFENLSSNPPGDTQAFFAVALALNPAPNTATFDAGATTPVPEPSTMAIAGLGALAFIGYGLRRRLKK